MNNYKYLKEIYSHNEMDCKFEFTNGTDKFGEEIDYESFEILVSNFHLESSLKEVCRIYDREKNEHHVLLELKSGDIIDHKIIGEYK